MRVGVRLVGALCALFPSVSNAFDLLPGSSPAVQHQQTYTLSDTFGDGVLSPFWGTIAFSGSIVESGGQLNLSSGTLAPGQSTQQFLYSWPAVSAAGSYFATINSQFLAGSGGSRTVQFMVVDLSSGDPANMTQYDAAIWGEMSVGSSSALLGAFHRVGTGTPVGNLTTVPLGQPGLNGLDFALTLQYDATTQNLTVLLNGPAFGTGSSVSLLGVPAMAHPGILLNVVTSNPASSLGSITSTLAVDNLTSNLVTGRYTVNPAMYTHNSLNYNDVVAWFAGLGLLPFGPAAGSFTLSGDMDLNVALVSLTGGARATIWTVHDQTAVETALGVNGVVDAFFPSVCQAQGVGVNYLCGTGNAPTAHASLTPSVVVPGDIFVASAAASSDPDSTVGTNDDIVLFEWFLESDGDGVLSAGDYPLNGDPNIISSTARFESLTIDSTNIPAGVYRLYVRAQDSTGLTSVAAVTLRVNTPPVAALTLSPNPVVADGGVPLHLDGSSSVDADSLPGTNLDIVQFVWYADVDNSGTISGADLQLSGSATARGESQEADVSTLPVGSYAILLEVVDRFGARDTATVPVVVQRMSTACDSILQPIAGTRAARLLDDACTLFTAGDHRATLVELDRVYAAVVRPNGTCNPSYNLTGSLCTGFKDAVAALRALIYSIAPVFYGVPSQLQTLTNQVTVSGYVRDNLDDPTDALPPVPVVTVTSALQTVVVPVSLSGYFTATVAVPATVLTHTASSLTLTAQDAQGNTAIRTVPVTALGSITLPNGTLPLSAGLNSGAGGCSAAASSSGGEGAGSSVNLASGNLYVHAADLPGTTHGPAPTLHYNHQAGIGSAGQGWSHGQMSAVYTRGTTLYLQSGSGAEIPFRDAGDGTLVPAVSTGAAGIYSATVNTGVVQVLYVGGTRSLYSVQNGLILATITPNGLMATYEYDGANRLVRFTDFYGRAYSYTYNGSGLLETMTDPSGAQTTLTYSGDLLTSITDARGYVESFDYDAQDRMETITDKSGFVWTVAYDALGRVVSLTDDVGNSTVYSYDSANNRATVTDRRGYDRILSYDPALNVITRTEIPDLGRVTTHEYNPYGDRIASTDEAGYVTQMEYDAHHQLTRTVNALGDDSTTTYNAVGLPLVQTDYRGYATTLAYDSFYNLTSRTDALNQTESYTYDSQGNQTSQTNAEGETSIYGYTDGVMTSYANALGDTYSYEIDSMGRTTASIDPLGYRQESQYDAMGNLTGERLQDGYLVTMTLDEQGRVISNSAPVQGHDHEHKTASIVYDHNGDEVQKTTFLGFTTYDINDPEGYLSETISLGGRTKSFERNAAGENVKMTDGDGVQQQTIYDIRGYEASVIDANGETDVRVPDALGRPAYQTYAVQGSESFTDFDANGNEIAQTTNGRTTTSLYDALNRVVAEIDPEGNTTTYSYDAAGRRLSQTDALGRTTSWVYDDAGRKIEEHRPDGGIWRTEYNARGEVAATIDARNYRTEYVYDARGNQTERHDPMGGVWRTEYDVLNRVVANVNPLGERTEYTYDLDNRKTSMTDPLGRVTQYEYDNDSNLTAVIEPDGVRRHWYFAPNKHIVTQYEDIEGDVSTRVAMAYDLAGKLTQFTDENGHNRSFEYDTLAEQTAMIDALGNRVEWARDADVAVTQLRYEDSANNPVGTVDYAYDLNKRLVQKSLTGTGSAELAHFTYDGANQLTQRKGSLTHQSTRAYQYDYSYDAVSRRANVSNSSGTIANQWDPAGNRTQVTVTDRSGLGHTQTNTYDGNNRLVSVSSPQGIYTFQYDAANRRIRTNYPDGSYILCFYDAAGQVLREVAYRANGSVLFEEVNAYDPRGNLISTQTESEIRQYIVGNRDWTLGMQVYALDGVTLKYAIAYTYDNVGNMLSQTLTTAAFASTLPFVDVLDTVFDVALSQTQTISYSYDAANRLVSETGAYEGGGGYSVAYSYDAAGNMVRKTKTENGASAIYSYTWSGENRILAVDAPGTGDDWEGNSIMSGEGKEQHTWPLLRRTGATDNELNVVYDHDSNHIVREKAGGGRAGYGKGYILDVVRDRVLGTVGEGHNSGGIAASTVYFYQNFRGDVRAVSDGSQTDTRTYLPTGVATSSAGDPVNFPDVRYGFQGKEVQTTGLADFENRFYAAHQGRFGSRDPLSEVIMTDSQTSGMKAARYLTDYSKAGSLAAMDPTGLYTLVTEDSTVLGIKVGDKVGCRVRNLLGSGFGVNVIAYANVNTIHEAMGTYIRRTINKAGGDGGCIWNRNTDGNLRNKLMRNYDAVSINCAEKTYCASVLQSSDGIARNPIKLNSAVIDSSTTGTDVCAQGANVSGASNNRRRRYVRAIFHELIHTANPSGDTPTEHTIIDRCQYSCKSASLLDIPSFNLNDDLDSEAGKSPAARCSGTGN